MERLIAKMGMNFKNGPTPHQGAGPKPAKRRRYAFSAVAFLAALAVGLLFLLPGGLLQAQDDGMIEYAEDRTDAVATFTASDPEGRPVYWSLLASNASGTPNDITPSTDSVDVAHFSISASGVLSFEFSPDYENPRGAPLAAGDNENTYRVVVVAADEPLGDANRERGYKKITVNVTDMDEPGMVSLSSQQPQAGVALNNAGTPNDADDDAADTLEDHDASPAQINAAKWKWEHSDSQNGPWTPILTATAAAYTPLGVEDKYLRVTATYTDKHGSGKTAMAVSAHAVRAEPAANNANPVFPDEDTATVDTQVGRKVDENSPPGTRVGDPVVANDAPGDVLTYTLSGSGANDSSYRIDPATGQIMVGPRTTLDREEIGSPFTHTVQVVATDPAGGTANQDVIITINDVNEAPVITAGDTKASVDENTPIATQVGVTYTAYPEASDIACTDTTCTWSLEGPDAGDFEISNVAGNTFGQLTFKKIPNYEASVDANGDNVYMVTVVVTDAGINGQGKLSAERDMVVTVTNMEEEGTVTLSSVQPKVGVELTAMLSDPDGGETDMKWQWYNDGINADDLDANAIDGATSATYSPKAEDAGDTPIILHVRASYTDAEGSGKSAMATATNAVVADQANRAPVFKPKPTSRSVKENYVSTDAGYPNVGAVVAATDPNNEDVLTYTLGGADAALFKVHSEDDPATTGTTEAAGQITVKTATKLDREEKGTYMVTVTATDPGGLSDSVDVTIKLTDVDEAPEIAGDDVTTDYRENGTAQVAGFTATDPERRPVYWSLLAAAATPPTGIIPGTDSADVADFSISANGVLSFNFPPDFEMMMGGGTANNSNTYKVVVVAADEPQGATNRVLGYKKATVNVTNVEEAETVTLSARQGQVNVALTATYNDVDNEKPSGTNLTWKWYLGSSVVPSGVTQNDSDLTSSYTPTRSGSHRVEASYTKTDGSKKSASAMISVRATPTPANVDPNFPTGSNRRSVDENSVPGTRVGGPVVASDPGDTLTYTLGTGNDEASYRINQATGQITVGLRVTLDFDDNNPSDTVNVVATDPAGGTANQDVIITINDVNEAPVITAGDTKASVDENTPIATQVGVTYTAYPEASDIACTDTTCTWSLEGPDAGDFEISNVAGNTFGQLTFKKIPNYEASVDANGDNVYMVTVVVTDAGINGQGKLSAERDMVVTVTNMEEEGTVTLSSVQPKVGVELTAMLSDPDGGETDMKWQWYNDGINADDLDANAIDGATSATYSPKAEDAGDTPIILHVRASYTDAEGSGKSAMATATNAVVADQANRAPVFKPKPTSRSVKENYVSTDAGYPNVGAVVAATDPNNEDVLTYTLGGADAALFKVHSEDDPATTGTTEAAGQITVKTATKLDREEKGTYMVTVTATDPGGLSDSVDVTIKLTDVDEAPEIIRAPDANVAPEFASDTTSRTVAEKTAAGQDIGTPVAATDHNGDTLAYTLGGTDAASFDIDRATGQLMTEAALDYEAKASYDVTVTATDPDSASDMITVTITVTNEEEMGEVTLWAGTVALTLAPQVGDIITGAVMDPDGGVTGETWQWSRTMTPDMMDSWMDIAGETDAAYTVTAGDEDYYLRVMAHYTDGHGSGKTAMEMTANAVTPVQDRAGTVTLSMMQPMVGTELTAMLDDPDDSVTGEMWQWARSMDMTTWENITGATMETYTPTMDDEDMYLRATVMYTDGHGSGKEEMAVSDNMVTTVQDQPGTVTLSMMQPMVDTELTAMLDDPDDSVTGMMWQWARSMDMTTWEDITGATMETYTPTMDDEDMYLRATVMYTDGHGSGKEEMAVSDNMVTAEAEDTLLNRYDANDNDEIDLDEVFKAIDDYFDYDDRLTLEEVYELVDLYFES